MKFKLLKIIIGLRAKIFKQTHLLKATGCKVQLLKSTVNHIEAKQRSSLSQPDIEEMAEHIL